MCLCRLSSYSSARRRAPGRVPYTSSSAALRGADRLDDLRIVHARRADDRHDARRVAAPVAAGHHRDAGKRRGVVLAARCARMRPAVAQRPRRRSTCSSTVSSSSTCMTGRSALRMAELGLGAEASSCPAECARPELAFLQAGHDLVEHQPHERVAERLGRAASTDRSPLRCSVLPGEHVAQRGSAHRASSSAAHFGVEVDRGG